MSPESTVTPPRDPLSATAASLRAVMTYVSASDERTDPTSVINRADPDEPVFVLRARDMVATAAIEWWMWCARNRGVPADKLEKAERQRRAADLWIEKRLPHTSADPTQPVVHSARMERENPASVLNQSHPDEPVFVIVASDAVSVEVVEYWAFMADRHGAPAAKVEAALEVAKAMARWTRKRVVGTGARPAKAERSADRQADAAASRPRHRTHMRLVCLHCGHTEKLGAPPYDEEVLAAIKDTVEGPCPSCGATTETAPDGLVRRALTTEMVAPEE
ncbi:MAG: hypothetical protein WCZ23_04160 [Rhodospirillaceae bacterium]